MRDKFIFAENDLMTSEPHRARQKDISHILRANKQSRKLLETIAHEQLKGDLQNAAGDESTIHSALNEYERAHLDIGSWPRIRASLKLRWRNLRIEEATRGIAKLYENIGGVDGYLGEVYLDHLRFVELDPQPTGVGSKVYVRRNDAAGRHYVMLPATNPDFPNVFVRRFVIRGLNGHNAIDLDRNGPLKAAYYTKKVATTNKPQPQEIVDTMHPRRHPMALSSTGLSEQEMLISHTRGWKKRYLSAGVGNKPPLSTRGTVFTSLFGNVVIDLAKVETDQIFDLHAPIPAQVNLGLDPQRVVTQGNGYPATDYDGEQFLALRDVLRTRELVIKREVPHGAVVYNRLGKRILALGFKPKDPQAEDLKVKLNTVGVPIPVPPPANTELEDFTWTDQKRWFFLLYKNASECSTAQSDAHSAYNATAPTVEIKTLNKYDFTTPAGMLLT